MGAWYRNGGDVTRGQGGRGGRGALRLIFCAGVQAWLQARCNAHLICEPAFAPRRLAEDELAAACRPLGSGWFWCKVLLLPVVSRCCSYVAPAAAAAAACVLCFACVFVWCLPVCAVERPPLDRAPTAFFFLGAFKTEVDRSVVSFPWVLCLFGVARHGVTWQTGAVHPE